MKNVVIIGGGLGGLFTGALLSKNGYKVTVLEKNRIIGGGLQCFRRKGVEFETGMHILGGFQEGGNVGKICHYLGILDKLSIMNTDPAVMDMITSLPSKRVYNIPQGRERFTGYFSALFPNEAAGIKNYVNDIYALADEVDLFYLREQKSSILSLSEKFLMPADELIASHIDNSELRYILAYMAPMYAGIKGHTPAYIHALINVLYIDGASMFVGGSQQLADLLAGVIENGGGEVLSGSKVEKILVEERAVKGVVTEDGREFAGADWYISAIHPALMVDMIEGKAFTKSYRTRLKELPNSYSTFTVYVKFKEESFPFMNHPSYLKDDNSSMWNLQQFDDAWPRGFMYITSPVKNQGPYAEKMTINCVMDFSVVERWKDTVTGRRGADYEGFKERCKERVLAKMERLYPNFRNMIDYCFTSSPLTIRDYYGSVNGALYGYLKDCNNITACQVPIYTKVSNLLLTGQNNNLHGICGVPLTAIDTAEVIVGKNMIVKAINESVMR